MNERPPERSGEASRETAARPPLGRWGRLYALVILALAADVVLLWLLTERYR